MHGSNRATTGAGLSSGSFAFNFAIYFFRFFITGPAQGHTRSHKVTQGHTRSHKVTQGHTRSHKVTQGHTRSHKVTQGHTRFRVRRPHELRTKSRTITADSAVIWRRCATISYASKNLSPM